MAALDDDLMVVTVKVRYPAWMEEMSVEEFNNTLKAARRKAINAFNQEIDKAESFWRNRKAAELDGQMDIYDYV